MNENKQETPYEPTAEDVREAAIALGMPDRSEVDRRDALQGFEDEMTTAGMTDQEVDKVIAQRSSKRGNLDRRRMSLKGRIAVGLAASGVLLSPVGEKVIDSAQAAVVGVVDAANERLDQEPIPDAQPLTDQSQEPGGNQIPPELNS